MESQVNKLNTIDSCVGWKEIIFILIKDSKNNIISCANFENIYPITLEEKELLVYPVQTLTDKQFQALRTLSINTVKSMNLKGVVVVKCAINMKKLNKNASNYSNIDSNIKILETIAGKNGYVDICQIAIGCPLDQIQDKLNKGQKIEQIKGISEPSPENLVVIDIEHEQIELVKNFAEAIKKLDFDNLGKDIETFYEKEFDRINAIKQKLQSTKFLSVWDIRQAKKYGFTNEEISKLSNENIKEINAICIGNGIE